MQSAHMRTESVGLQVQTRNLKDGSDINSLQDPHQ